MTTKQLLAIAGATLALLGLVACGNNADRATAATGTVHVQDFKFRPGDIDVSVGTTVVWTNDDSFLHTVTSGDFSGAENKPDGLFDENLPKKGSTAEVTFDEAGSFTYFCKQHNVMNAAVTVTAS
jgi:plastocyanin